MTDYKQLCADLADDLELADWPSKLKEAFRSDIDRARAALAEPEPEYPTDEELEKEFGRALLKLPGDSMNATAVAFARAVLARWGNHPESPDSLGNLKAGLTRSPAAGEVAELVASIRQMVALAWEPDACLLGNITARELARVADLLECQVPQPVPVSERLPEPTDEPMMPDHYRGDDIRVYREGFYAGYKYAFQLIEKHSDV